MSLPVSLCNDCDVAPHNWCNIVFAIVNEEPNAEECKARLKKYEEENKSQIIIRQSQRGDEERTITDRYVILTSIFVIF